MQSEDQPIFVVFGGSFNPIHESHVACASALTTLPGVEQVLVVPARLSPFKSDATKSTATALPGTLRMQMVQAAMAGLPRVAVLDLEMRQPPPSYTCNTIAEMRAIYPRARLQLAMGWDAYRDFSGWKNASQITRQADLLVVARKGADTPSLADAESWTACLPESWRQGWSMASPGRLQHADGRCLHIHDFDLPPLAASDLLLHHSLDGVPEPARSMLAAHWAHSTEAAL